MTIDIGIASYRNPDKLRATIASIKENTRSEWTLKIFHNPSDDPEEMRVIEVIDEAVAIDARVKAHGSATNVGYAGAVNWLVANSDSEFFFYSDNDTEIRTPGWDLRILHPFEHPEVAQVFPGRGHYHMNNGRYDECLWSAGYCWALRRSVASYEKGVALLGEIIPGTPREQLMDASLGHHEEVDLMIRLRMAGYQIACRPDVEVIHHETATNSPESAKRIHRGVVNWMNRWNRYFVGDAIRYPNPDPDSGEGYDPRALRYNRWPPCALYMERWTLAQFPDINKNPEVIETSQGPMDIIKVLRDKGYYHERSI